MNRLIVFDMDGVLVDACDWHRIALNTALKRVCGYEIPLDEHYSEYNGLPTRIKLQSLTERGVLKKEDHDAVFNIKQDVTKQIIEDNAVLRKEKVDLFRYLKQRDMLIACYTNCIRETAEMMLYKTGILDFFDDIVTNEDVNKPKPDPEGYLKLMEKFCILGDETIIVEDSPNGIKAARSSGAKVIEVNNPNEVTIELIEDIL